MGDYSNNQSLMRAQVLNGWAGLADSHITDNRWGSKASSEYNKTNTIDFTHLVPKLLLPLMSAKLFLTVTPSKLGPKSWWKLGTRSFAETNSSAGTALRQDKRKAE